VADVFISYAREDKDVARRLAYLLEREAWTCWWDPHLEFGQDFRPVVSAEIEAAKVVTVIWTSASRVSSWVRYEVDMARRLGKLVELHCESRPSGHPEDQAGGSVPISDHPHIAPTRDEVLAVVARVGGLRQRRDGWNSRLTMVGWRSRAPRHPVIGWEWDPASTASGPVRRERWMAGPTVSYGTTIGNAWSFGHEGEVQPIGQLAITRSEHTVHLPRRDRRAERRTQTEIGWRFVTFNVEVRVTELLSDAAYPGWGEDLADSDRDDRGHRSRR
jgi:hypothetical protein